jgi:hypothetical protein
VTAGASTDDELNAAFAAIVRGGVGALLVAADPYFDMRRERIIGFAERQRLPAIYQFREFAVAGGLLSYGISLPDILSPVRRVHREDSEGRTTRLARLLLLLANFGKEGKPEPIVGKFSQETLAEMIGTTRSRVSVVAPECVERRREPLWYYTWDCASGCVWSPNAVKELKPLSQA